MLKKHLNPNEWKFMFNILKSLLAIYLWVKIIVYCLTSYLLSAFSIAIENMADAMRSHPQVNIINWWEKGHIISLYADDILLFFKNPIQSVPVVLDIVVCLVMRLTWINLLLARGFSNGIAFPFNFSYSGFTFLYLGIYKSYQLDDLLMIN